MYCLVGQHAVQHVPRHDAPGKSLMTHMNAIPNFQILSHPIFAINTWSKPEATILEHEHHNTIAVIVWSTWRVF